MELSSALEEYLKTMYILSNTQKEIRVTDIANKLNKTKPSVNKAIRQLSQLCLINYEAYKDITLTKEGINKAKEIIKKQDILKTFFVEVLEIEENIAEEEAKAMKHAVSKSTEQKLERYINKILDLGDLECGYDKDSEKCRSCVKITAKNRLKK